MFTPIHPRTLVPIATDIAGDFSWREVLETFIAGIAILVQATYAAGVLTRRLWDGPGSSAASALLTASSEALDTMRTRSSAWSQGPWAPVAPIAAVLSVPAEAHYTLLRAGLQRLVERLYPAAQSLVQQGKTLVRAWLSGTAYALSA